MRTIRERLLIFALLMPIFVCAPSQLELGYKNDTISIKVMENTRSDHQEMEQVNSQPAEIHLRSEFPPSNNKAAIAGSSQSPVPVSTQSTADSIADSILQFGHNMGLYVNGLNTSSEIFSPLSIVSALSLLMLGSRGKSYIELETLIGLNHYDEELCPHPGKYHEEFGALLDDVQHFAQNNANDQASKKRKPVHWRDTALKRPRGSMGNIGPVEHTISVANGIFVQKDYSLNPDYIQIVKSVYESELTQVDYQRHSKEARDLINQWVDRSTHSKIPQIITSDIARATNIILASVVYFRGLWETGFFPRSTGEDDFFPDGVRNPPIRVQMMTTAGVFPYYEVEEYDCHILGLPYKGNETTMYVIQPNDSSREKLRALQAILNAQKINAMIENMVLKATVMVFPKMRVSRTLNMKSMLQSLGLNDIFDSSQSDLTLIGTLPETHPSTPTSPKNDEQIQNIFNTTKVRKMPTKQQYLDRFNEPALIFRSRLGEEADNKMLITRAPCNDETNETEHIISPRQTTISSTDQNAHILKQIEEERLKTLLTRSDLYVDDILHNVDFAVDEYGTEAAAATHTYVDRSNTDVVFRGDTPFLIVIRHDPTKLPLFYGVINKPEW